MGKVYLIGAGPGAADLLTVRATRLLASADIVFHDALVHLETLALAVKARKVAVGKRCSRISTDQRFINRALVEAAARHEVVVRLKGGDPMLFGRAQEEIDALSAAGVAYEIVPGITSALAASAEAGVSLTRRGLSRSVVFVTPRIGGDEAATQWVRSVLAADTAVLYMASVKGAEVSRLLEAEGLPAATPALVIENASLPHARHIGTTLRGLRDCEQWQLTGPAIVVLGKVCAEQASTLLERSLDLRFAEGTRRARAEG
jgi:uroporphyrin-III C-methyltransferase